MPADHSAKRTSDILHDIVQAAGEGEITLGDFVAMLEDRSFALAILILALPNALPIPGVPGVSTITGLPILFIALQIVAGREAIWLPRRIAEKRFKKESLTKIVRKSLPAVKWLEKYLRPRFSIMCKPVCERVTGMVIAIMAFILALPIAGANFFPGFSIALLSLTLLEDDGVFATVSLLFALILIGLLGCGVFMLTNGTLDWFSDWM